LTASLIRAAVGAGVTLSLTMVLDPTEKHEMGKEKKRKKIEGETGTEENRHGQHLDLTCMRVDRSERNMRSTVKSASRL